MAEPQQEPETTRSSLLDLPSNLRIISLNCWGLKFLSKHRHARLTEIGHQIASITPPPHIVGLQECWTQEDYLEIRSLTNHILPHGKFYWSGVFGSGLVILSAFPIEESSVYKYPLNGRPAAFFRGDWFVGKGVASARIRFGKGAKEVVEVFCTHLHAPYEADRNDSYICHRTAQAWEIAKKMRHAVERGHVVVGLGDFNMLPGSLAHGIIEAHGGVRDVWRVVFPESALGNGETKAVGQPRATGRSQASAKECLDVHGTTCDSAFNTWRWSKAMQKDLGKGRDTPVDAEADDPHAKRLDYIFFADNKAQTGYEWRAESVKVGMTGRHPTLKCSLSDHFSVELTLIRSTSTTRTTQTSPTPVFRPLPHTTYTAILDMISTYMLRERAQRRLQIAHWWVSVAVSIGCFVAVWWSPHNYVAFILMVVSTLGLATGVLDGLMGFLFVKTELRALKEFRWEIEMAAERAREIDEGRL